MLDAFIIEELEKERQKKDERVQLELPLPNSMPYETPALDEDKPSRGVTIIGPDDSGYNVVYETRMYS